MLALVSRDEDLPERPPAWLKSLRAGKPDADQMRRELQQAADRIATRRAARDRRRERERAQGEAAFERAHLERDGPVPVAASIRWWGGAQPPLSIW